MEPNRAQPLLLAPASFTPPSRTPWGGRRILHIKAAVPLPEGAQPPRVVGESWELSMTSEFPSRDAATGRLLSAIVEEDPLAFLGHEALAGRRGSALLVKLLDAAEPLSVQIHPEDSFARLAPSESGKPECWYIVAADRGAGIYFGLTEHADRNAMERALATGVGVESLLQFVPVEPGDFFVVHPGTPHAIGAGVTLVEPQRVAPGKKGVTYRYFDWNRRYDEHGALSDQGKPRALHVEEALAVTAWDRPRGSAFLDGTRHQAGLPDMDAPASLAVVSTPELRSDLDVARLSGSGDLRLPTPQALRALTVLEGDISIDGPSGDLIVRQGRTAVLPYSLGPASLHLRRAHAVLSSVAS